MNERYYLLNVAHFFVKYSFVCAYKGALSSRNFPFRLLTFELYLYPLWT